MAEDTTETTAAAPKRTRMWKTWQLITTSLIALVLGVGIGGASSSSPDREIETASSSVDDEPTATTAPREVERTTTTTAKPSTTTTAKPAEFGSRSNPLPLGQSATLKGDRGDEWILKVVGFNPNGTDAVLQENSFNDPPAPGRQFAMVRLEATYVGADEPQSIGLSASFKALDAANVSYDTDDSCGVIPDELDSYGDVYKGGVIAGWQCWSVTSAHIDSLVLVVEPAFAFDSEPYFMAVK
jgi:hypothetical protein